MHNVEIDVEHITRVEGHGNIVLNVKKGKIEELRLDIPESPRFFEAMVVGRRWDEVAHITSRICGICACGHTLASVRTVESAMGITPTAQTVKLRRLLLHGEVMQSHVLHFYILAAPDFLGAPSVFPLIATHKDVVLRALRLKRFANELCALVAGQHVHPCVPINGFARYPTKEGLEANLKNMRTAQDDLSETVKLFKTLKMPSFERKTEYLALKADNGLYPFYEGDIGSTEGWTESPLNYKNRVKEFIVDHSTAKHAKSSRESYMVGALARINNNYELLHPKAKAAAEELGLSFPCYNPFINSAAQLIETIHCVEESIELMDDMLKNGLKREDTTVNIVAGRGVGAVEVPRGTLYHDYTINAQGIIEHANCVIPTAQNFENIEKDFYEFVPQILDRDKKEIELLLEMLVRAYDPCISCSTHLLHVKFVE
jgi:coenzyme F420-reducing hydrogenase alpha subunit